MANGEVSDVSEEEWDEWDLGLGSSSNVAPPRRAGDLRSEGEESKSEAERAGGFLEDD